MALKDKGGLNQQFMILMLHFLLLLCLDRALDKREYLVIIWDNFC